VKRFFLTGTQAQAPWSPRDSYAHTERGHGRGETRRAWSRADLKAELRAAAWPGLQSVGLGEATRTVGEKTAIEPRFSLSSLPPQAGEVAQAVRKHWGSENQLQWTPDVTFREDQRRLRMGYGAENFAVLRPIALHLLRQEPSAKRLPRKRLACALNPDYLLKVLLGDQF